MDALGNVYIEQAGNGVSTLRDFDQARGHLNGILAGTTGIPNVQSLSYKWDKVGNLTERTDQLQGGLIESFLYDPLNRVTQSNVTGGAVVNTGYNAIGNVTSKSDVGTYNYHPTNKPHAVSSVTGTPRPATYTYDNNGNLTGGAGRTVTWTPYNKPSRITSVRGSVTNDSYYGYGHDRRLTKQYTIQNLSGSAQTTSIHYPTRLFEVLAIAGAPEYRHHVMIGDKIVAVYTPRASTSDTRYFHRDHLGSVDVITKESGQPVLVAERMSFDAWGQRRETNWQTDSDESLTYNTQHVTRKGYTGHEQADAVGLVHLGGRVYDPVLGRFMSADPFVQFPDSTQGFNRYSYVNNNPLSYTDPSGYFPVWVGLAIFAIGVAIDEPILAQIGLIAIGGPGLALEGKLAIGFASGLVASDGDIRQGIISGLTAAAFHGVGKSFGDVGTFTSDHVGKIIAHGVVGGVSSELSGGKFKDGFLGAGFAETFAPQIDRIGDMSADLAPVRVVVAAVVGGTASELGGGKFANGAVTGAFSRAFNDEHLRAANPEYPHLYDGYVDQVVGAYNTQGGYSPGDAEYLSPDLVKAMIRTESGYNLRAYIADPMQVNVTGDWVAEKAAYGLQRGVIPGPALSIEAGVGWLGYKSYRYDAQGIGVQFRGWESSVYRYNGGGDPNYVQKVYSQCPTCPR